MALEYYYMDLRDETTRREFLQTLPHTPGVYIMKGVKGKVLYVGKAKDLFNRVNSYFRSSGDSRRFVRRLPRVLVSMEIIIVESEREALLLENNLIKEMKPRYNVLLKDDKSYQSIRVNLNDEYPRFIKVRGLPKDDGNTYFGPYHSARSVKYVLSFMGRYFKFRTCSDRVLNSRKKPCLQYHIKRCDAPCCEKISKKVYRERINEALIFLNGDNSKLIKVARKKMKDASEEMQYERAARYRDLIYALDKIVQPQNVVTSDFRSRDAIGYAREGDVVALIILEMRKGTLQTHRELIMEDQFFPDDEILTTYILQHYSMSSFMPEEIIIPFELSSQNIVESILSEKIVAKAPVKIVVKGADSNILSLAQANARNKLLLSREMEIEEQLKTLAGKLKLLKIPDRIECYDISHLQGRDTVASMVVFKEGVPEKSSYRRFKIEHAKGGDDYGALREVMERRLNHRDEKGWELPDLVVIDGGKGQLNSVVTVFREMGVPYGNEGVPIVSLAKERGFDGPPDRYFAPGVKDAVNLKGAGRELYILSRIRDEAHRFAVSGHRKLRTAKKIRSQLELIPGVGKQRVNVLLKYFGSIDKIREANVSDIASIPGIGKTLAQGIVQWLMDND
jgi:excinuclease ABC subunit C